MSSVTQTPVIPAPPANLTAAAASALAPAKSSEYNRLNLDFHTPMPRPKVRGLVIDAHTHLIAARHGKIWFETAKHFGIDAFVTMAPLEEALGLQRDYPEKIQFIVIPAWQNPSIDDWLRRLEMFYNGTMAMRHIRLDSPALRPVLKEAAARGMILMSHVGDPDTWYSGKYADTAKYGSRDEHYAMWEGILQEYKEHPWLGAHMGGNPENLPRLQDLLDRFPNLYLDNSATRWMVRELSARRDAAREFVIRNSDRILFGTDQVSGDDRGFDFLASRFWAHRKLWETAYNGPSPIYDPDLKENEQPVLRGLALPDEIIQKLYHDNAVKLLGRVGVRFASQAAGSSGDGSV
jgi:hypothetical protein